jgi:hypothetical protein
MLFFGSIIKNLLTPEYEKLFPVYSVPFGKSGLFREAVYLPGDAFYPEFRCST